MKEMKRNLSILILLLSMVFISCNSLLEENPEYTLNGTSIFADSGSAQLALNACYGYMAGTNMYGQFIVASTEIASGISWAQKAANSQYNFASLNFQPADDYNLYLWAGTYKTISETNAFIDGIENSSLPKKDYLGAQAKFIRALCYYNLVFIYGGVPLRLGATTKDNIFLPRSTKDEVLDQVIKDLEDAILALNDVEKSSAIPSKITAYAMLAKVCFLRASSEGEASSKWQKAKIYGDKAFALAGTTVQLEPKFATLFNEKTTESAESLFKLNYSMNGTVSSFNKNSWMYSPYNSTLAGIHYPNRRVSKAFFNYFKTKHPTDPRIDVSYFQNSYINVKNNTVVKCYPSITDQGNQYAWAFYKKPYDSRQTGQIAAKMFVVYRYADFLLLMADVENELGNTAKGVDYVNQVLKRARLSVTPAAVDPVDVAASVTKQDLRQIIFDERLFELNQEGHTFIETRRRGYDFFYPILHRHNTDQLTIPGFTNTNVWSDFTMPESRPLIDKAMLMPIPESEINSNSAIGIENQNPGY